MATAGYRSPEGLWIGGIASPPPVPPIGGYRSFECFWLGGASAGITIPPIPPHPITGETGSGTYRKRFTHEPIIKPRRRNDDAEVLELLIIDG